MRIGVLGTGTVGRTLGTKLVSLGHDLVMGSREAGSDAAASWAKTAGPHADEGNFEKAASFGELIVNATAGGASVDALVSAGAENLAGKVLLDVANPLDFSAGMPPTLTVCNTNSLGEQIQRTFPQARVVKSLNTVNADVMVDPAIVPGTHNMFVAGNEDGAKETVKRLLVDFGWPPGDLVDLGGIEAARGMEMYLPLWLRLYAAAGTAHLNINLVVE